LSRSIDDDIQLDEAINLIASKINHANLLEKKLYCEKTIIEYMYNNKIETIKIMLEIGFTIPRVLTKLDIDIISKLTSKTNNYILQDFILIIVAKCLS
jgi:hypothetical protein